MLKQDLAFPPAKCHIIAKSWRRMAIQKGLEIGKRKSLSLLIPTMDRLYLREELKEPMRAYSEPGE